MGVLNLNQTLLLYAWFPLAVLLFIMLLIARFYQNLTGERTHYVFFGVPIVMFGIAVVHYANVNQVMGNVVGDLMLFVGGSALMMLCLLLYRQMTAGR